MSTKLLETVALWLESKPDGVWANTCGVGVRKFSVLFECHTSVRELESTWADVSYGGVMTDTELAFARKILEKYENS